MSVQFQFRRGNTTQNNSFTGVIAEISIDTSTNTIRVHDAITAGGTKIMPTLSLTNTQRLAFTPQAGQLIFVTDYVSAGVSPTWMGDGSSIGGIIAAGSVVASASTATNLTGGSGGQIPFQTAPGVTSFFGPGSAGTVLVSYGSSASPVFQNTLTLAGTTAASSTTTGALVVGGGVGVGGNLYVGGEIVANKLTIQLTTVTTTLVQTDDIIQTLNVTQSSSTTTGALQVAGGAGIGLDITVGGSIRVASVVTATTFIGNLTGNITGNGTGNLHYQSANNTTSFLSTGTTGQLLVAAGGSPVWTTTSSIQVGYAANILGLGTGGILYESANNTTSILSTATTGNFLQANYNGAPTWTTTASMYVARAVMADISAGGANTATNIYGGNAWQIPYQSAPSTTLFASSGTTGQFWQAATNGAPTWTSTSSIYVNSAVSAETLYAGTAGQIVYQSAASTTAFISTATTGNFLQANYAGAPTWTTTASMYVNDAVKSTNLRAGTAGQLHYQSAVDTSGFISTATTGNFLQANYVGAPTWTTTANIYVNSSVASEKLYAGTAGQLVYQSAVSTTAFLGTATTGNFLQANFAGAPTWTTTANIYVANAAIATNVRAGTGGQIVYQSAVDTSGFISTATTGNFLQANFAGAPTWTTTASMYVARAVMADISAGGANTATNIYGGNAWQIPYQSAPSTTLFASSGTTGQFWQATTNGAPAWTTTASMYVNSSVASEKLYAGTAGQIVYQSAASTTAFLGTATTGNFLQANYVGAPTWTTTASMYVNDAVKSTNLRAGTAGQLHYQSAVDTSGFISTATTGNFLQANYVGAPTWTTTASIYVNSSVASEKLYAGTAGQLVYQSAVSTTAFLGTATTGNFLQANYVGAPTWTTTANIYVADSVIATNVRAGTAGQIVYQSAVDTSGFISTATTGNFLQANFAGAPTWTTTASMYVNRAVVADSASGGANTATNLSGGNAWQIPYQSAPSTTLFASSGTTGQFWQAATNGAPTWTTTANIYVANAAIATNVRAGTAGQIVYQSAVDTTTFISTATTGNFLQANFVGAPTWTTTASMYVANAVTANNLAAGTAGQVPYQTAAGATSFFGAGTFGQFLMSTGANAPVYQSTLTQAGGNIIITSNTAATSTTTGALQVVNGGVGIGGNLYVGGEIVATKLTIQLTTVTTTLVQTDDIISTYNYTNATSTITGALQVAGGAGIGRDLYVGGNITVLGTINASVTGVSTTATNIANGTAGQLPYQTAVGLTSFISTATTGNFLQANYVGAPTWTTTANIYVNDAVKSTNLRAGTAGQLHYQSAADTSGFISTATTGNFLQANFAGAPTWTTTASMYVNSSVASEKLYAGTAGQLVYQSAASTTAFISTATTGNFLQANFAGAPTWTTTASMYVNRAVIADSASGGSATATNLAGGNAWQIPYQSAPSTTLFASSGTTGQFWQATTNGAPTWTTTANIYVANAAIATSVRAGTTGQLVYQSAADTSGFVGPGTAGQLLVSAGASAPVYTNTASIYVGRAVIADSASGGSATATNLAGGNAWQIPYQSAPSTTLFANSGTTGQFWQATTNGAPAWTTTANMYVANSVIATNVRAGTAGQLHYQSAVDTTAFVSTATTGNFLQANYVGAPTWTSTGSMYVNRAVIADSASGGSSQVNTVAQPASASYYPTFVDSNNASATAESVYTTSSFVINPSTGNVGLGITPAYKLHVTATTNVICQMDGSVGGSRLEISNYGTSLYLGDHGVNNSIVFDTPGNFIRFLTNSGNERLRITSGGGISFGAGGTAYGTTGQVLQSNGNASPTWVAVGSVTAGTSTQVQTVLQTASANYYPTFVDSNNATATAESVYTTSTFFVNPASGLLTTNAHTVNGALTSTGASYIGSSSSGDVLLLGTSNRLVFNAGSSTTSWIRHESATGTIGIYGGNQTTTGLVVGAAGVVTINAATASVSSATGALIVTGGVGVGGAMFVTGNFTTTGALVVGTTTPGVAGSIQATNEITAYFSDRRLKENVQVINNALVKVLSLTGITYTPNDLAETFGYDKTQEIVGLFADEVDAVLPQAVKTAPFDRGENGSSKSGENYKTVQYEKLIPLLVEAIKEQQKTIDTLSNKITALTAQIDNIKPRP